MSKITSLTLLLLLCDDAACFGSTSSGFTQFRSINIPSTARQMGPMVMYEKNHDPPSAGSSKHNMWSVLADTERWISDILGRGENPYTRKEVSYICELSDDDALVVAGLWRRLREGRELCESHGQIADSNLKNHPDSLPPTLRQTQVIVLPNDSNLDDWETFDRLISKINACRRNARDFILDAKIQKLEATPTQNQVGERDWSVSINCAHLHPNFGALSKEEELRQLKEEPAEVDVNMEAYKKQRLLARRSPYPTVCVEVRATPSPDFSQAPPPPSVVRRELASTADDKVTLDDVHKLEALFGKAAVIKKESYGDDAFWDALGQAKGIQQVSFISPFRQAQIWVADNHDAFHPETSTFTTTDCEHVDEAYEFVFNNIAMEQRNNDVTQYLVYTDFMSSSATSFEKFAGECQGLVNIMPSLQGKILFSTLHPEHINESKRSPVPALVMRWK